MRRQGRDHETDDHDRAGARRHGPGSAGRSCTGGDQRRPAQSRRERARRAVRGPPDDERADARRAPRGARRAPDAARHPHRAQDRAASRAWSSRTAPRSAACAATRRGAARRARHEPPRAAPAPSAPPPTPATGQAAAAAPLPRTSRPSRPASPAATTRRRHGNGFYGEYQFTQATWAVVGGTGNPAAASPAEQDERAAQLYAQSGLLALARLRSVARVASCSVETEELALEL